MEYWDANEGQWMYRHNWDIHHDFAAADKAIREAKFIMPSDYVPTEIDDLDIPTLESCVVPKFTSPSKIQELVVAINMARKRPRPPKC
jgi:hypothetical protein